MYLLREPVGTITYDEPYDRAYESLLARLRDLPLTVVTANKRNGEVVVRCLCGLKNYILWRCWSDKLLFRMRNVAPATTRVEVYAIPNFLRFTVRRGETVSDPLLVVRRLS
jgi:hypothetical protein